MNKLVLIFMLGALIGCEEYDKVTPKPIREVTKEPQNSETAPRDIEVGITSTISVSEAYETSAFKAQKKLLKNTVRGMVSIEKLTGKEHTIFLDEESGDRSFKLENVDKTITKTILKIEGSMVYTLKEEIDARYPDTKYRSVEVSDYADTDELIRTMYEGKATIRGNVIYMQKEWESSTVSEDHKLINKFNISSSADVTRPCESVVNETDLSVIGEKDGQQTELPNQKRTKVAQCGHYLSAAALKSLDLSNVVFCDHIAKGSCEENKDMSYLTSDL